MIQLICFLVALFFGVMGFGQGRVPSLTAGTVNVTGTLGLKYLSPNTLPILDGSSNLGSTSSLSTSLGGTGLSSGTSGGILGFTGSTTLASSGVLTANQLIVGGGAGATPATLLAGTQNQVMVMGAVNPGWGQVNLGSTSAVTGTLGIINGGLGNISATSYGVLYYDTGLGYYATTQQGTTGLLFHGATGNKPTWAKVNVASEVTGSLGVANGGTGNTSFTTNGVLYYDNVSGSVLSTSAGTLGYVLTSQGAGFAPVYAPYNPSASAYATKSANYTLTTSDYYIKFSGLGAGVTATLPTAVGIQGQPFVIKNADSTYNVTINTTSAQTLDGRASGAIVLAGGVNDFIIVVSDGSNWIIESKKETSFLAAQGSNTAVNPNPAIFVSGSATVSLTKGTWRLSGFALAASSIAASSYDYINVNFFAGDGANNGTTPTALSTAGTVIGYAGTPAMQIPFNAGAGGNPVVTVAPFLITVSSTVSVYLVPNIFLANAGSLTWASYINAERVW